MSGVYRRHPEPSPLVFLPRRAFRPSSPPYGFALGRTAFRYGLMALGISANDRVLLPELIGFSLPQSAAQVGVEIDYYSLNDAMEPRWEELDARVGPRTRAILMLHYFGQPANVERFLEFCQRHRLLLIEDSAHGYGGRLEGRSLNSFGDISIDAPRKQYPILNGAYLYLKPTYRLELPDLPVRPMRLVEAQLKHWGKHWIDRSDPLRCRIRNQPPYHSQDHFREPLYPDWLMDERSHEILRAVDQGAARDRLQDVYSVWEEWTRAHGLSPVFQSLHPEAMPSVFAAFAATGADRLGWFDWGFRNAVDVHSWPTLPIELYQERGRAFALWERLLFFPIHSEMDPDGLRRHLSLRDPQRTRKQPRESS